MERKAFEYELPQGYTELYRVDAKNKKVALIMNLVALFVMALVTFAAYLVIRPRGFLGSISLTRYILFMLTMLSYMLLHELTHGAAYKALTHQKLTFGMTFCVAYCGVPNIYVYRRTALIALLAPFVLFTAVFGAAVLVFSDPLNKMLAAIMLGLHVGGCSGDLYDTFLYLTKLRDPDILMRDTGPEQTFYGKV